jgi:hypothetical protein
MSDIEALFGELEAKMKESEMTAAQRGIMQEELDYLYRLKDSRTRIDNLKVELAEEREKEEKVKATVAKRRMYAGDDKVHNETTTFMPLILDTISKKAAYIESELALAEKLREILIQEHDAGKNKHDG